MRWLVEEVGAGIFPLVQVFPGDYMLVIECFEKHSTYIDRDEYSVIALHGSILVRLFIDSHLPFCNVIRVPT
jgi:hypothetical protein